MNVTYLKTRTFTTQAPWSESRNTAFVRNFTEGVRLVKELRQLRRTKERIDNTRQGTSINQVNWCENLIVTDVHTLTNSPRHTRQTNAKLGIQLLTYRAHTAISQVVNIVNLCTVINQTHDVLNDSDNIIFGQNQSCHINIRFQLTIDFVTTYFTQVVTLIREEQLVDNTTSRFIIWWVSATQLTINIIHRFNFRRRRVFLQRVVYNGVIF